MCAMSVAVTCKIATHLSLPFVLSMSFQRVLSHNQRQVVVDPIAKTIRVMPSKLTRGLLRQALQGQATGLTIALR